MTFDPHDRHLCDDGNCLGVVVGGKCNLCGMASASGAPRDPGSGDSSDGSPRDPSSGGGDTPDGAPRDPSSGGGGAMMAAADHDAFDPDRQLCPDGACTGVLGPDGKCKECGRSAAS